MNFQSIKSPTLPVKIVLLSAVVLLAFFIRVDSVQLWQENEDHYFLSGEPLISTLDGYFYLNEAKEFSNNTYSTVDPKRAYPDLRNRSSLPPLLSVVLSSISTTLNVSLNWAGVFLPCILGLALSIPLYLFGKHWGGFWCGLSSVSLGLFQYYYASRTSLGRLDTDCMNVTFVLLCAYFFMQFGKRKNFERYWYLISGFTCYLLFLWWWDQAPHVVSIFSIFPFLVALVFFYRPVKIELLVFYILGLISLGLILNIYGVGIFSSTYDNLTSHLSYLTGSHNSSFPNVSESVSEQNILALTNLSGNNILTIILLILSFSGLAILTIQKKIEVIFLLPLIIVGSFSLFWAQRYAIFLTPVIALTISYLFFQMYGRINNILVIAVSCIVAVSVAWSSLHTGIAQSSHFKADTLRGMQSLKIITPKDSIVWSNWNNGHSLIYWTERTTVSDGMFHGGYRSVFTSLPMVASDFRLAANYMHFYVNRGPTGIFKFFHLVDSDKETAFGYIKSILKVGPEHAKKILDNIPWQSPASAHDHNYWLNFFYPKTTKNIYLFLDQDVISTHKWTHWYGTWNFSTLQGQKTLPSIIIPNINFDKNNQITNHSIDFDRLDGAFSIFGVLKQPIELDSVVVTKDEESLRHYYSNAHVNRASTPSYTSQMASVFEKNSMFNSSQGIYNLDINIDENYIALMDKKKSESVINRLFRRKSDYQKKYFIPVVLQNPHYQIWRVTGDSISSK